jgi:hypothetical protein
LWVPIVYYRKPPHYFRAWKPERPPRWAEHWGAEWQARHNQVFSGPVAAVARAPLPVYQSQFTRGNYPRAPHQQMGLHNQNYAYQPREAVVRQAYQSRGLIVTPNPRQRGHSPPPPDGRRDEPARDHR